MIGGGVLVFVALAFAVFQFAGAGLDEKDAVTDEPFVDPDDDTQDRPATTGHPAEDIENDDVLSAPRAEDSTGIGGTRIIPKAPMIPGTGDMRELNDMQERIRKETAEAVRQAQETLAEMRKRQEQERLKAQETIGPARQYLINSRPFALIYLDGGGKPINADGKPAIKSLKPGWHTFRAVNKDLVPPVEMTFKYEVKMGDLNNALILNLETRSVESRRNPTLPF